MIDNYDSFTYNLVQYFAELEEARVIKDELNIPAPVNLHPQALVISPGPPVPGKPGYL